MDKKFELTNESVEYFGITFYRIKALKNFGKVRAGDLGGFVEKESNLSQRGNCWVYDDAIVYNDAVVYDNAEVYGGVMIYNNAEIYDNALAYGYAHIYNNAKVYGNARIFNTAEIFGDARVYGHARVYGAAEVSDNAIVLNNAEIFGGANISNNASVYGKAMIFGNTTVCDTAMVSDNAKVYNSATVCGKALVCGNAEVNKEMKISNGIFATNTLEESIRCQTGLIPCNGEIIAYKQVNKDLTSFYDRNFKYIVGKWVEVKEPDISDISCASGLHFSNATYWDFKENPKETTFLIAKIQLEDIITVQQGKIRCKRAFIMGTYNV